MSGEIEAGEGAEPAQGTEEESGAGTAPAVELEEEGPERAPYSRTEWRGAIVPAVVFIALVIALVVAWYLVRDTGPEDLLMEDLDEEGSFTLLGHWRENLTAYGSHVHAINLTLEEGDTLNLTYTSHGPPGGVQVRVQHPLNPADGTGGAGGTRVYASSVGGNGSIDLFVLEPGAYQVYFWHPGAVQEPGPSDDADDHTTAVIGYRLVVDRGRRS